MKKRHEKIKDKMIPKKPYWIRWDKIIKHAVKKIDERVITKREVHENLTIKILFKTKISWYILKRPSYRSVHKQSHQQRRNKK